MLVLSRKKNETIHIGTDITITIVRIKGEVTRVGIDAPKSLRITRDKPPGELTEDLLAAVSEVTATANL